MHIGIITVRDPDYHPNRRLLHEARRAGHQGTLIHPYRLWPQISGGQLGVTAIAPAALPHVVLPRQGAQIGDACLTLIHQLELMSIPLINDTEAIAIARNKILTQQVLTAAGLPCPDTIFVNDTEGFFHAVDQLGGYPVVVKQVGGRQGDGVLRVMNPGDARQGALPAMNRRRGLIIQRYLPPAKRRDIRALIIAGKLLCAATLIPAKGDFRANFHLGGSIQPTTLSADLENIAVTAAAAIGCDVAGVDIMVDVDDRPWIVEVNYSPGFKGLEAATGLDIAGRMILLAINRYHTHRAATNQQVST